MKKITTLLLLFVFTIMGDITVEEIVKKANNRAYYNGKDGRAKVSMIIKDSQGRKRKRSFTILRKDIDDKTDGKQNFFVYFNRPSDLKDMTFLVWKETTTEDNRWLYLPSLDLVKRIAGSDKRTSFAGSHFFYEDISGRGTKADIHKLVSSDKDYYILESTPKNPNEVEFSKYTSWIHKTTFIPVKIIYIDKNGEPYREYTALKVEKINGYNTAKLQRMKDLRSGAETLVKYLKVEYDIGIDDNVFTERSLKSPPMNLFKFGK